MYRQEVEYSFCGKPHSSAVHGVAKSETQLSHWTITTLFWASLAAQTVKNLLAMQARELGSIPGLGRSLEEGNGYPLQYSCLENSVDRGAWLATVHRVAKSRTRLKWLALPLSQPLVRLDYAAVSIPKFQWLAYNIHVFLLYTAFWW